MMQFQDELILLSIGFFQGRDKGLITELALFQGKNFDAVFKVDEKSTASIFG
jgi:hypothetical protein